MSGFVSAGGAAFSSDRMDWETPAKLFEKLDAEYHFTLDPASDGTNAKCKKYYTAADNGLLQDWGGGDRIFEPSLRSGTTTLDRKSGARST